MAAEPSIARSLEFLREADKLKAVLRQTRLTFDANRRENDAEHSWHLALMALVLFETAAPPEVDLLHALRMVLIHDLVEIDAGDSFLYDEAARVAAIDREKAAADRIFALLPPEGARDLRAAWDEFEDRITPTARFARALDRVQPILQNLYTEGAAWRANGVTVRQVRERNGPLVREGAPALWPILDALLEDAVKQGFLLP